MERMEQIAPAKKPDQVEVQGQLWQLGDMKGDAYIQNALTLLLYELRHRDTDVTVIQDDRKANDASIQRAAADEWSGDERHSVKDVTHPAAAFRVYKELHHGEEIDIHDRQKLIGILTEMGVDITPPTLH